jgi:hypothetical protein
LGSLPFERELDRQAIDKAKPQFGVLVTTEPSAPNAGTIGAELKLAPGGFCWGANCTRWWADLWTC